MTLRSGILLSIATTRLLIGFAAVPGESDSGPPAVAESADAESNSLNPFVDLVRAKRESEAKLREALKKPVTISFKNIPLEDATKRLAKASGVTIVIHQESLAEEGISIDQSVSCTAKNITLHQALLQILEPVALDYQIENEVVQIMTEFRTSERYECRLYDVSELIAWAKKHRYTANYALLNTLFSTQRPHHWLFDLIETNTRGPWLRIDHTGGELEVHGTTLSVWNSRAVHDEIPPILEMLTRFIQGGFGKDKSVFLQSLSSLNSDLAARRALAKRVRLDFENVALNDIADGLTKDFGVPVLLDGQAMIEEGVRPSGELTFKAKDVTLESALTRMLEQKGLTVVISNGTILITTLIACQEKLNTAAYDVRDLIRTGAISRKSFLDSLRIATSGPWEHVDGTGGRISEPLPGLLIVWQTEDQHLEFTGLLDGIRAHEKSRKAKGLPPRKVKPPTKPNDVRVEFYNLHQLKEPGQVKRAICDLIEPDSWDVNGGAGRIRIVNSLMIVKNSAKVHRRVHGFMTRLSVTLSRQRFDNIPFGDPFVPMADPIQPDELKDVGGSILILP